jgi:hypothetical protein
MLSYRVQLLPYTGELCWIAHSAILQFPLDGLTVWRPGSMQFRPRGAGPGGTHRPGKPAAGPPGGLLVPAGLVATVTEAFARMNLLGQLVTWNVDWGQWPVAWSVSWPVAWIGLGLIIFARVTRIGAGMRADLEGTV